MSEISDLKKKERLAYDEWYASYYGTPIPTHNHCTSWVAWQAGWSMAWDKGRTALVEECAGCP